jgi:hypothetical protein
MSLVMEIKFKNEDFFQVLGRISIFFATADFITTEIIIRLIKDESRDEIKPLEDSSTLTQKLKWLQQLTLESVTDSLILEDLKFFLPWAIDISLERNRYIHDQWVFNKEDILVGKINRARIIGLKKFKIEIEQKMFTIDNLYTFLTEVGEMQKKLFEILNKLPSSTVKS